MDASQENPLWKKESPPADNDWTNVKIGGHGYVPGLVFHPVTPDVYYARTDIGGAYRWDKDTSSWHAITDSFGVTEGNYIGAESIALDPNDDDRVYMSTGRYVASGNGRLYCQSAVQSVPAVSTSKCTTFEGLLS